MKIFKTRHVFDYNWEEVTRAAFRKYPNKHTPRVSAVDVLKRNVDSNGRLHSLRLITSCWSMWTSVSFVKMLGLEGSMYGIEKSVVDPVEKTLTLRSRNITLNGLINVIEVLQYRSDPAEPSKTVLVHEAEITISSSLVSGFVEGRMVDVFGDSATLGRQAIADLCLVIQQEDKSSSQP